MKIENGLSLNTDLFRAAIEIEQCGSISHAAANLFVSQPNLSAQIKTLEQTLGYKIFERSNTGVKVTAPGKLFLDSARIIVSELENIKNVPNVLKQDDENFSIVCVYSVAILNKLLAFRQAYPANNSNDSFKETGYGSMLDDLVNKRYRLGFLYELENRLPQLQEKADRFLLNVELVQPNIPLLAVVSKNHPLARLESISVESLANTPLVAFEYLQTEGWLEELGLNKSREILCVFDRGGMLEIIAHGRHVGISVGVPRVGINEDSFELIPITGIDKRVNQYWMKPASYELSPTERRFLRFLSSDN